VENIQVLRVNEMRETTIIYLAAITALTIIQIVCLLKDYNHVILASTVASIVQLANLAYRRLKR